MEIKNESVAILSSPYSRRSTALLLLRFGDDFVCGIGQVARSNDCKTALREQLATLFRVGSFNANDDRHLHTDIFHRSDDAFGDHVAADDAAEDVHENCTDILVGEDQSERLS